MKINKILTALLHIINPIALLIIINQVLMVTPDYWGATSVTVALLLASVSLAVLFLSKNWLIMSYHLVYAVLFAVGFITFPLGVVFALPGGVGLTLMVLFGVYMPLLLLVISNAGVFLSMRKSIKTTIFKQ
ncbi:hypothetical protein [Capnocytophaga sp.]|uniref:hypothetical protein n=1 Tax=Capnocytophaga sp. TaxID=44737 RepID=UPI0026DBD319|nr:hypothetical protein [Capnocytophaga sp.]MDO5104839.1 hypothetical protein [Capnocytophaga sp.]